MTHHIALLRGVNVGGHGKLPMAELRTVLAEIGLKEPRTLLASGNAVFRDEGRTPAELEAFLHHEVLKRFAGLNTQFFVRTAADWARLVAQNPFPDFARDEPARYLVWLMREAPDPAAIETLRTVNPGREYFEARGRRLYIAFPDGQGESKLALSLLDKHLSSRGTGRNWNTVMKLDAMVREPGA